jgi:peroxiredoxin
MTLRSWNRPARVSFGLLSAAALLLLVAPPLAAKAKFNKVLDVGSAAPAWKDLPGVDGKTHSLADFEKARALVVVFTCNHCPVAKMYEERLLAFASKYQEAGVQIVAINVNRIPADSLEKMKERAADKKYPFPYLYDESQESARSYGATVTPHFFLLDGERKIAYMGAFDDNFDSAKVEKPYLVNAVEAVLAGKPPAIRESLQRGCGIEYE